MSAQREVLAGAVLDVHERAALDPEATLPGAAVLDEALTALEGMGRRLKSERDEALQLLRRVLGLHEIGDQGEYKTTVRAFLARIGAPQVLTRSDRQRAIERDIVRFNPDTVEALELLASFERALTDRYGEARTTDLCKCLGEVGEALSEVEAATAELSPEDR